MMRASFLVLVGLVWMAGSGCEPEGPGLVAVAPALDLEGVVAPVVVGVWTPRTVVVRNRGEAGAVLSEGVARSSDATELRWPTRPTPARPLRVGPGESVDVTVSLRAVAPGAAGLTLELGTEDGGDHVTGTFAFEKRAPASCDDGNPCTQDRVDIDTGGCRHEVVEGACDDGNACTQGDVCVAGRCLGEAVTCDDGVACTEDICDPRDGCQAVAVHSRCDDDVPCTDNVCAPSGCQNPPSPDGTPCGAYEQCVVVDVCVNQGCVPLEIPEGAPCDDGTVCTGSDSCTGQVCGGTPAPSAPEVDAFRSHWITPSGATLVFGGVVSEVALGGRMTLQTASLDPESGSVGDVTTRFDLSAQGPQEVQGESIGRWARAGDSRYARLRSLEGENTLEVLQVDGPLAASVVQSIPTGGPPVGQGAVAVAGDVALVCAQGDNDDDPILTAFDLVAGAPTGATHTGFCQSWSEEKAWHLAAGDVFAKIEETGAYAARFADDGSIVAAQSWGFNPSGISNYGVTLDAFVGEFGALMDIEHPTKFFFVNPDQAIVYGNAPALSGRRIVGLHGRTVLIHDDWNHIVVGTLSEDFSSITVDEQNRIWVPSLHSPPDHDLPLEVIDFAQEHALIAAVGGRAVLVDVDARLALFSPDQTDPLTGWAHAGGKTGFSAGHGLLLFDELDDALDDGATPWRLDLPRGAAHIVGSADSGPTTVLSAVADRWGGPLWVSSEQAPRLTAQTRLVLTDVIPSPTTEVGTALLSGVPPEPLFPTQYRAFGKGCTLAQVDLAGNLGALDLCGGPPAFYAHDQAEQTLVTYDEALVVHDPSMISALGLYGEAVLFERDGATISRALVFSGSYNTDVRGAGLSAAWWVLTTAERNAAGTHMYIVDRASGDVVGSMDLPDRGPFFHHDPVDVLMVEDGLIYIEHHDAAHEQVLVVGLLSDGSFGEVHRIDLPARARAAKTEGGQLYILTEAGLARSAPVCAVP